MEAIGIVRNLDDFGRVTIPIEIRKCMGIKEKDPVEILLTNEGVLITPYKEDGFSKVYKKIKKAYESDKDGTRKKLIEAVFFNESEVKQYVK